jgi:alkylation response protein AidB-like acyl-CoA dehydrogenase
MTGTHTAAVAPAEIDDADRLALREAVRDFLADRWSLADVQRLVESPTGYDPQVWQLMAEQLGLLGLMIPVEFGGSGSSWSELAVVLEELGSGLVGGPFLATVALAANVLAESGNSAAMAEFLPRIAAGECTATVAVPLDGSADLSVRAADAGHGARLTGEVPVVLDGKGADVLLVPAVLDSGELAIFVVLADATGLSAQPIQVLDLTRRPAQVTFTDTPAQVLVNGPAAAALLDRVLLYGALAVGAEQAGGCAAAMRMSVDYAKIRHQFGRPIGAFQAIKHLCADMLLATESTAAAARRAALAMGSGETGGPELVSVAKAYGSTAYLQVAVDTVQVHGGIGYTWEHPAHLHLRRAKTSALLFGDAGHHRTRIATELGM